MDRTPNLDLPYIMPSQAQKHVTHNEALRMLDAVTQISAIDRDRTTAPVSPMEGERHIVASGASGDWVDQDGSIAAWQDGSWQFYTPQIGWMAWIEAENILVSWDGTTWIIAGGSVGVFETVGVGGAVADSTNRLASSAPATLLNHSGSGHQLKLNKNTAPDTASLLFQTGFSGRAEFGLTGDDDWHVKVSPDGSAWHDAIVVGKDDGSASFPAGIRDHNSGQFGQFYVPSTVKEIWRSDISRTSTPRSYTVSAVSGDQLTLATASAGEIFNPFMRDSARIRIWNTTRSESTWVDYDISTTVLRVTNSADISAWSNGDTLRLGDPNPTDGNVLSMIAIDIGSYLFNNLGSVFRQSAIGLYFYVSSSNGPAGVDASATGAAGSAAGGNALSNGTRNTMSLVLPCSVLSPISNSNLVYLRESQSTATDLSTSLVRVLGVYV